MSYSVGPAQAYESKLHFRWSNTYLSVSQMREYCYFFIMKHDAAFA